MYGLLFPEDPRLYNNIIIILLHTCSIPSAYIDHVCIDHVQFKTARNNIQIIIRKLIINNSPIIILVTISKVEHDDIIIL